jgi:succinate dehydrogenase/fumarate reductase-like Fe-S protein
MHNFSTTRNTQTVFDSFAALGKAFKVKPAEPATPKSMKCRKCGSVMRNISGTNVFICDGQVEKVEGKGKHMEPCGNRAFTSVRSESKVFENAGNSKPAQKGNSKPAGKTAQVATV